MRKLILVCVGFVIGMASWAHGARPTDVLRERVEQVISILKDHKYEDQKALQREKIMGIISHIFDFGEMSKRALANYWRDFTPPQQQEFTDAFSRLLENIYLNKIESNYKDQEVRYQSQDTIGTGTVVVRTRIVGKDLDVPVNYSMYARDNTWWIYDVTIEGVSLVQNYRSQFRDLLLRDSPAKLIVRVQEKVAQQGKK